MNGNFTRQGLRACCLSLGLAFAAYTPGVQAAHDYGLFELDRNAIDSNGALTLPDDWDTLYAGGADTGGHSFAYTGVVSDPVPESSIFTGGGSKDNNDITQWKWKQASNILDKDNLTNAYAAAYAYDHDNNPATAPHLVIYFGLDRYSNNGSAQVGFWFFKNNIGLSGDGTSGGGDPFVGSHANGDVLVQSNFSNGGVVATVTVFEWMNGNLVQIATGGDCVPGTPGEAVCGTVNQQDQTAPWPYTPKPNNGSPGTFPQGTFFEGGIDLTALGLTDACFSTFMAESRSSTPFDSTLKDFVGPHKFDTCKVAVTKFCTNPRLNAAQDHIIYDINGTVTASGFGSNMYDVTLSDNPAADGAFKWVDCNNNATVLGSFPLDTLNGDACYTNTMTVPLNMNGTTDTVTVNANTGDNGSGTALSDKATAQCPNLKISPNLSVTKDCVTTVAVDGGKVVAKVNVKGTVCNTGDSNLHNVTVDDLNIATSPDPLVNNVTLSTPADPNNPTVLEGACQNYTGYYFPSAALDDNGAPTTCPYDVVFKDTVRATAVDIFGADVTPQTDMASCKLCTGQDCAP